MSSKIPAIQEYTLYSSRDIQFSSSFVIGTKIGKLVKLNWIEALYLYEMKPGKFNFNISIELLSSRELKKYFVYRDLRRRSLYPVFYEISGSKEAIKSYENAFVDDYLSSVNLKINHYSLSSDGYVLIPFDEKFKGLYEEYWFGQRGLYKSSLPGKIFSLDRFEAYYLYTKKILKLNKSDVFSLMNFKNFEDYFSVYSSWRDKGFIVKTGFKFGADFRIYFPGVSPKNFSHSKHVLHVFPRGFNMKVEELSRAIRVANSVKKTFILAVPSSSSSLKVKPDFYVLDRSKNPSFAVKTFSQEDKISSRKLASLLNTVASKNLSLLFSISDRETSVTYYEIKKIELPSKSFDFYEVKWINP